MFRSNASHEKQNTSKREHYHDNVLSGPVANNSENRWKAEYKREAHQIRPPPPRRNETRTLEKVSYGGEPKHVQKGRTRLRHVHDPA
jgi:hypothetical protein